MKTFSPPAGVRFAPSPTGEFHLGNLRTAWISEKLARALNTPWIIRVEDIDSARVKAESWEKQKADLAILGLFADSVIVQSDRFDRHFELFERAKTEGRIYPCDCSRQDVLEALRLMTSAPHGLSTEYSGQCRGRSYEGSNFSLALCSPKETLAWRWKASENNGYHDAIVARTDPRGKNFVPGYHWACATDDALGNYDVLVRAWDLAPVERTQNEIREWVTGSASVVSVFHTALVTNDDGSRLEKRTKGVTLAEFLSSGAQVEHLLEKFDEGFDQAHAVKSIGNASQNRAVLPIGEIVHKIPVGFLR